MEPIQVCSLRRDALRDLEVVEILSEVERHMEGLTHGIDETAINQILMRLQQHTIGVPSHIFQLLCKITRVVVSYQENFN